jgi:ABC-type glycerol-3-phosphate transport system substrate-binding protein
LFATASLDEFYEFSQAFIRAGSQDKWTVLAFPGTNGGSFLTYGSSYVILKSDNARQLAAWLFVRWMLSPENQARWVKSTSLYPLRASSLDALQDYGKGHPQWQTAVELLPLAQIPPQRPAWRKIRPLVGDAFLSIFRLNIPAGQLSALLARMDATVADLNGE